MNNEKYLNKIKKLLNLAKRTTNANEAANAMSQAQALMRQHGLNETDVELSAVTEFNSKTAPSHAIRPPMWMTMLTEVVRRSFGVSSYYQDCALSGKLRRTVVFYGPSERPQIAAYAFDVLSRQLTAARNEFNASQRKSLKRATKITRADNFCEGWCRGVYCVVKDFAMPPAEKELIDAYTARLKSNEGMETIENRKAKKARGADDSIIAGFVAGKAARLNHGVAGAEPARIGRDS
ncbi:MULTISPECIES: DUF2786 domain-containing protein [Dickeya]|uniref:Uncharacterized protein n=1 Tax=Dickeya aquatica TaxID=1401087 RepID=A0A375A9I8_9GAMM|nr:MULTISPECIES: DUF2786 domain-containing protein [Dickeya]SLM62657.1 FIG004780: hypothetical protein in PFGI-1-like cluster [Dickeya aquatica]